jgi:hypothetical protein
VRIRSLDQVVADLVTVGNYIAQEDPGAARKVA